MLYTMNYPVKTFDYNKDNNNIFLIYIIIFFF